MRKRLGLATEPPTLHMSFTGNPGTGKTTVALRMAGILHALGFVRKGHLVSVTRDDLVGQYIGHTAPKTKEILKKAMGGVLFIDEAYYLYRPENERDYGQEAIEILLQVMENQREDLVVPRSSLMRAALSSPSSKFKRPLTSLSFAANYLATGLDPFWMKLTNVVIHLLNGLLVFLLSRLLLQTVASRDGDPPGHDERTRRVGIIAALIAAAWMLLPINLTGVLYVVQRMESMANLFVLLGLIGYVSGRQRMLSGLRAKGLATCVTSLILGTGIGFLAKETAVMLPLYAFLVEWMLFGFRRTPIVRSGRTHRIAPAVATDATTVDSATNTWLQRTEWRVVALYVLVLALPLVIGLAWLLPGVMTPGAWASRDFDLHTRLLSEARIVVGYIVWTLLPTPHALSFYHDNFHISTGLLSPGPRWPACW